VAETVPNGGPLSKGLTIFLGVAVLFVAAVWQLFRLRDEDLEDLSEIQAVTETPTPSELAMITASICLPVRDLSRVEIFSVELPDRRSELAPWVDTLVSALSTPPSDSAVAVVPVGLRPRHVFVDEQQTLYVDWPAAFAESPPAGAEWELLTVKALARTLVENVPGVRAVKILVEGADRDTLWGHVDIRHPIVP
jgi:hypothetical protein